MANRKEFVDFDREFKQTATQSSITAQRFQTADLQLRQPNNSGVIMDDLNIANQDSKRRNQEDKFIIQQIDANIPSPSPPNINEEEFESNRDPEEEEEDDDDEEDDESLDGLNIDKDEDIQQLLTELNDTAIQALKNEDNENSLECLKRGEQLLEAVTAEGKDVDRNLIIVILYNLACTYQRMSMLEDSASYLDGTIYNLEAKVTNFDDNESIIQLMLAQQQQLQNGNTLQSQNSQENLNQLNNFLPSSQNVYETTKKFNISSKLFKQRYMCKCHLQLCAVLSQLNKHQEALYHGQMAAFYCQELIRNTLLLCKSYIQRLLLEKGNPQNGTQGVNTVLKDIENELGSDFLSSSLNHGDKSMTDNNNNDSQENKDPLGGNKRTSYYVEENERILNLLITNCEPILSELVAQVDHFNTYNQIQKVVDKSGLIVEEYAITNDCMIQGQLFNHQKLYLHAQSNANIPNTTHNSNYNKLKNTYITQLKSQKSGGSIGQGQVNTQLNQQQKLKKPAIDEMVPEELEKKKKIQLNESTYYNTKGQDGEPQSNNYFAQLRNNVKTILGVKEQDDWIFNLNIGNVMHLLPMSLEELNLHIDNSHELSRDAMLEKIILLSVSYFCVGTELRFLSAQASKETAPKPTKQVYGEIPDPDQKFVKADSEMWHAQALEASGTFLPSECPLVSHIIMSYQKHHSPAMTTIPEDEPLIEELKVVRPLNEIKNDQVNYHQIIRAYNTKSKIKTSRAQSRNQSRPQTSTAIIGMQNTPIQFYQSQQIDNTGSKIKVKKRQLPPDLDLDLLEPDDQAQFIHSNQLSNKSQQQHSNFLNSMQDSPAQQTQFQSVRAPLNQQQLQVQHMQLLQQQQLYQQEQKRMSHEVYSQNKNPLISNNQNQQQQLYQQFQSSSSHKQNPQLSQQIKMPNNQNLNHLMQKPPVSGGGVGNSGHSGLNQKIGLTQNVYSRNNNAVANYGSNSGSQNITQESKRPKTATGKQQFKGLDLNQRLMQTMNLGINKLQKQQRTTRPTASNQQPVVSSAAKKSSSSRLSGSGNRQSSTATSSQLQSKRLGLAMASPKIGTSTNNSHNNTGIGLTNTGKKTTSANTTKKVLLTQRLQSSDMQPNGGVSNGGHIKSSATNSKQLSLNNTAVLHHHQQQQNQYSHNPQQQELPNNQHMHLSSTAQSVKKKLATGQIKTPTAQQMINQQLLLNHQLQNLLNGNNSNATSYNTIQHQQQQQQQLQQHNLQQQQQQQSQQQQLQKNQQQQMYMQQIQQQQQQQMMQQKQQAHISGLASWVPMLNNKITTAGKGKLKIIKLTK